jgi:NAD(P)-dependent dehydrogenase (short-subunit alcohol dehydrogenase family)
MICCLLCIDGISKLSNVQFSYELNRRAAAANLPITSYSLHPGGVDTELARHMPAFVVVCHCTSQIPHPCVDMCLI